MPRQKKQHLKRRKDGRFCCVYHGKQFMGITEEEAFAKREEYKRQEQLDELIRENPTVGQYAERWLPLRKVGIRAVTYNLYVRMMAKLCEIMGDEYVRDIKPSNVKEVYSKQYAGLSDSYIKHAKALYVSFFASAVEDGLLRSNPALSEVAKPHKGTRNSHRTITPEERHLIETVALDHKMHAAAIVMLYSGLRPQEVKALRIDKDVDFKKGIIHVRSFAHLGEHSQYVITEEGKTQKATRDVPLFAPVREVLQGRTGYLLADKNGNAAGRRAWLRAWESYQYAMEKHLNGKLKQFHKDDDPPWKKFEVLPYDLRHSFATWCRDCDVELHTCVEWMGHVDATMILKIYDEVTDTRSQKEAERLERMLIDRQNHMQNKTEPSSAIENKGSA